MSPSALAFDVTHEITEVNKNAPRVCGERCANVTGWRAINHTGGTNAIDDRAINRKELKPMQLMTEKILHDTP